MTAAASRPGEEAPTWRDHHLNDDVVVEILQRLPTAAVLCARAVCKAWQRMTSSAEFIAAHARRRPLELIFQRGGAASGTLETIPLATHDVDEAAAQQCRRLRHVQYPAYTTPTGTGTGTGRDDWRGYLLIDSCDGLLLFQRDSDLNRNDLVVCNPVTQQWSMVPRVAGAAYTVPTGFYLHGPSGEHRLLCLAADDQGGSHYVCSLQVEGQPPRRLGQAWPWPWYSLCRDLRPVRHVINLGGKLHWSHYPKIRFSTDGWPPGEEGLRRLTIMAFDSVLETFRRIRRPPWKGEWSYLLEMDGMLAMGDFHIMRFIDIWVLQDYNDDESWTLHLRVDLPEQLMGSCWAMNTGRASVILLGNHMRSWVGLYDVVEKRVLKQTQLATSHNNHIPLNLLVFKDTLERHPSIFTNSPSSTRKRKLHT